MVWPSRGVVIGAKEGLIMYHSLTRKIESVTKLKMELGDSPSLEIWLRHAP